MRTPLAERFWPKVDKRGDDECWEWTGGRHPSGYGQIWIGGKYGSHIYAHRASWEINGHKIPDGMCVLHHCDNPPCVNPAHLFIGTQADNMRDKQAKGRTLRETCMNGHPFTPENTVRHKSGSRSCRICLRRTKRAIYDKNIVKIKAHARDYYLRRRDPSVKPRLISNVI